MEPGSFRLGRCSSAVVVLLCFLGVACIALRAQQPESSAGAPAPATVQPGPPAVVTATPATPKTDDSAQPPQAVSPAVSAPTVSTPGNADAALLKLSPGDLIEISVYNVPELAAKARIANSGDIYLPLIDYVHVADLTVDEAQALLEKRLSDGGFVRNPHVTIFVDESNAQGVTILGDVGRPGIYPVLGDRKLYDVISTAGGFTPTAGRNVSIIRHGEDKPITLKLPRNLADDLQNNVDILPGDTITVPRAPVIYVVGDVGHPAGLLVDNGSLTVLQAIALAGGTNHTAKLNAVSIVRKGPSGMTETKVPLKKMLEAKAPDVTLQGDDILFVPVSGGKVLAGRSFEAAMAAATAIGIYAVHP